MLQFIMLSPCGWTHVQILPAKRSSSYKPANQLTRRAKLIHLQSIDQLITGRGRLSTDTGHRPTCRVITYTLGRIPTLVVNTHVRGI